MKIEYQTDTDTDFQSKNINIPMPIPILSILKIFTDTDTDFDIFFLMLGSQYSLILLNSQAVNKLGPSQAKLGQYDKNYLFIW